MGGTRKQCLPSGSAPVEAVSAPEVHDSLLQKEASSAWLSPNKPPVAYNIGGAPPAVFTGGAFLFGFLGTIDPECPTFPARSLRHFR
jgi:hypothetical protein